MILMVKQPTRNSEAMLRISRGYCPFPSRHHREYEQRKFLAKLNYCLTLFLASSGQTKLCLTLFLTSCWYHETLELLLHQLLKVLTHQTITEKVSFTTVFL